MKKKILLMTTLLLSCSLAATCYAEQNIAAVKVDSPPVIDGNDNDPVWSIAKQLTTIDKQKELSIAMKAVYTDKDIYVLVTFQDPDESRTHKTWTWDNGLSLYKVGKDREDVFIIKWNMAPQSVDLSIYSDNSYLADVWFWKACRTDPVGYADDKMHKLGSEKERDATKLTSKTGKVTFLNRSSDTGTSAYKIDLKSEFEGETLPRYINRQPSGSRGNVRAKGAWKDGVWTIEFARALNTGDPGDVHFELGKKYLLGVSRYEIAGRPPDKKLSQPLYGTGDINELLWLHFTD